MKALVFDDLHVPHRPDYRFVYDGPDIFIKPGADAVIDMTVLRLYGSHGSIGVTTSIATPGTFVHSVIPQVVGAENKFAIRVAANSNAPAVAPSTTNVLTIVGNPDATSGGSNYAFDIPINVLESFDLEIVGMEVTQGIQAFDLPVKANPGVSGRVIYSGVSLAENRRTAVRVFPHYVNAPSGPWQPVFAMRLYGARALFGTTLLGELPGSPLWTSQTATVLTDDVVTRRKVSGTTFVLPPSWTTGEIVLRAEIVILDDIPFDKPPISFETNPANNSFDMTGILFIRTDIHEISPVKLVIRDSTQPGSENANLASPDNTFSDVRKLYPIDASKLEILPWNSSLDVTAAYRSTGDSKGRASAILNAIHNAGYHSGEQGFLVGVFSNQFFGSQIRGQTTTYFPGFLGITTFAASIFPDTGYPRTAVCHEIGHLCGRFHASSAGQATPPIDDWPPDQQGWLQGVGFDIDANTVIYPQQFGNPATNGFDQWFDFMSFAASESHAWISPRGWEETLHYMRPWDDTHPHQPPHNMLAEQLDRPEEVAVISFWKDGSGGITIGKTRAATRKLKPVNLEPESPYKVVLKNLENKSVITQGPSFSTGKGTSIDRSIMQAALPIKSYDTIGAIEIWYQNDLVAIQLRPPKPPAVTNISVITPSYDDPSAGDYKVSWTTTSQSDTSVSAHVDVLLTSTNGHQEAWKHVYSTTHTPPTPHPTVSLAQSSIPYNPSTKVRVTLSNSFFVTTSATSSPFSSPGTPPSVHLVCPTPLQVVQAGTNVYLHVEAFDDRNKKIREEANIVWECDGRVVARGMLGSWKTAMGWEGKKELIVRTVDYRGRKGEESVAVWLVKR
jgi:hypothetical protein